MTFEYRIGDWEVAPAVNEIRRPGETSRLEPKAMEVLVLLAEHAGSVVSREELLSALWPGVVVGDDALTQAVIKLRKALGDPAKSPLYIETISKRGYRLVAKVERLEPGSAPGAGRAPPQPSLRRVRPLPLAAGVVAVLAFLLAGGFWFRAVQPISLPSEEASPERSAALPTVTVMPFETLGGDAEQGYLARGIAADLATDISRLSALRVITASSAGQGTDKAARSPRYLVSGSLQRASGQLKINVRLIDTESGQQLWAERYERPFRDLFAVQEEITGRLIKVLPVMVSEAELRRLAKPHTRNLEAYETFQRGQAALIVRQRAENETAREMFRRAIALDAAFARAYSGLALTYTADYRNQWTADGAAALERALEMARTAYQINPDIPETYWVLAFVHMERRQHGQALEYLETAVRLYPSFADGYALMGGIKTYVGRPADAVSLLRTAMRLNPEGGYLYFQNLGRAYFFLGDLEQARVNLEHALLRNPVNLETHAYMAALHVTAGDKAAAAWEAEEIRTLQPGFTSRGWLETYPMTDASQKERLIGLLAKVGL